MSDIPDFDRAQNEATALLLKQNLTSLFIDVRKFKYDRKIVIDSVQNYAKIVKQPVSNFTCGKFKGCCVIRYKDVSLILFDDTEQNEPRKHWGIVHELGHIYLEHTKDGEIEEKEAHFFAAQIVMPEIVMMELAKRCGTLYPELLCSICNASYTSASNRISTFNRRCAFNSSAKDRKLLDKFKPILEQEYPKRQTRERLSCTEKSKRLAYM